MIGCSVQLVKVSSRHLSLLAWLWHAEVLLFVNDSCKLFTRSIVTPCQPVFLVEEKHLCTKLDPQTLIFFRTTIGFFFKYIIVNITAKRKWVFMHGILLFRLGYHHYLRCPYRPDDFEAFATKVLIQGKL